MAGLRGVLLLVGMLYLPFCAHAQFYPVQATTQLIPPYSVYLSDYATAGNEKLRVILLQRDLTQPSYQLRLVMAVELNGRVIMRTSRSYTPPPINLNPGIPTVISGDDLTGYVDSRNIDFVGYSRDQYERTKALPEGSYQITFTAYDYRRQDVQVSNAGMSFYYLSKNEPPLINFPACGTKIPMRVPQQIIFSWLSRNTSSPNSAADTEYELSLYETRPEGRNPNDVVLSTQPVFRITVDLPQYIYGPADPLLLDNMKYVWRVRAIDRNGKDAFRNNGYSEVCTFTYGGTDPNFDLGVVKNLQAEGETERKGRIWWDMGEYDGYVASYRKTGEGFEWFTSTITTDELKQAGKTQGEVKLFDLEPDTEYETRVQPKKSGFLGAYTDIVKFRTKPHVIAQCGVNPNLPQADLTKPNRSAIKGMLIQVDDIEIQLLDVLHLGDGWYKGSARTSIPYFGGAVFAVVFDRLYIDENRVAGLGRIDFVTQGVAGLVEQQNNNLVITKKDLLQKENREEWKGIVFYENIFVYDEIVITNVTADASNTISIIDNTGNAKVNDEITALLVSSPEKAIIIQDKNGDQYVVQKDGANTKITKVEGGGLAPGPDGTMLDEQTIKNLYKMILISLNKYKTAISQYQAATNPPKAKGGGDRVHDWRFLKYLATLPVCLEEHKDELDEIATNLVTLVDSAQVASHDFATRITPSISVITQEKVDEVVCAALAPTTKGTKLIEVTFDNGSMVAKDDGNLYSAPHWTKRREYPIAYKRDSEIELSAKFSYKTIPTGAVLKLRATNADGYNLAEMTPTLDTEGEVITISNARLAKKLINEVTIIDKFILNWEVSFDDGSSWVAAGTSENQIYVTLETPIPARIDFKLYESVLHIGCTNAKGKKTENDVLNAIWNDFVDQDVKTKNGKRLEYYGKPNTMIFTTRELLDEGVGQCGSFAHLFLDILYAQGINTKVSSYNYVLFEYIDNNAASDYGFFVKNWKFNSTGNSNDTDFPYLNIPPYFGSPRNSVDKNYTWIDSEVNDQPGVKGQSNDNPSSDFNNHQVVFYKGIYYDPSYGVKYSSLKEISENAIDGFFKLVRTTINEADYGQDLNGNGTFSDRLSDYPYYHIKKNPSGLQLKENKTAY